MNLRRTTTASGPPEPSRVAEALRDPGRKPLGRELGDDFAEELVPRLWHGIDARLEGDRGASWRMPALLAAAAVLVATLVLFVLRPAAGPLALGAGGEPSVLSADVSPRSIGFSDQSHIELAARSRLEVLRNDGRSFVTVLRRGASTFDVKPGGPRRWVVEAGLASVEVVGTRFEVVRRDTSVLVRVDHGLVLVRAESLPGGSRRLSRGESLEVKASDRPASTAADGEDAGPVAAKAAQETRATHEPGLAPSKAGVEPERGVLPEASTEAADAIDRLLRRADAARRRGDTDGAVQALEEVVQRASESDSRRGLAALSLARLTVNRDPGLAAEALDDSMKSMPKGLAEDALARRVEALGRSGRQEEAAELAREYLARFPDGHRAPDVRRWLAP